MQVEGARYHHELDFTCCGIRQSETLKTNIGEVGYVM